ncbi:MAG: hypothetical protein ACREHD_17865 [Pirellulales bacterium]
MARFLATIGFGLLVSLSIPARAQQPAVVQLPSVSMFGVNTSVSAPDRGSISLGGVGRSSTGSTAYGPGLPGNRSFGSSLSTTNASAHATVHDLDALDRANLHRAQHNGSEKAGGTPTPQRDDARRLAAARQSSAGRVPGSVAEARRLRTADRQREDAEAVANLKRARDARAAGKSSVAAMFYKLAARQATGDLKKLIDKEAASLASSGQATRMAHSAQGRAPSRTPRPAVKMPF